MSENTKKWVEVILPCGMPEIDFLNGFPELAGHAKILRYGNSNYDKVHVFVYTELSVSELEMKLKETKKIK